MTEVIRFTLISKEDLNLGTGTFKAVLGDGREVVLTQVDMCDLSSAQIITGAKTMTSPVINTPTITAPAITGTTTIGNGATITTPAIIAPAITGATTIGNGATITTPAITAPAITGATTIGTGSTITNPAIVGTTTNDNAATGKVGEYVTASLGAGSAISLTTNVIVNVTSISLTAGDWDVSGAVDFINAGATTLQQLAQGISTTSATFGAQDTSTSIPFFGSAPSNPYIITYTTPTTRVSLSSTTTVYLVARGNFAVSTLTAYGTIRARRMR